LHIRLKLGNLLDEELQSLDTVRVGKLLQMLKAELLIHEDNYLLAGLSDGTILMDQGVLELAEYWLERVVSLDIPCFILAEEFTLDILRYLLQKLEPLLKLFVRPERLHIEVRLLLH